MFAGAGAARDAGAPAARRRGPGASAGTGVAVVTPGTGGGGGGALTGAGAERSGAGGAAGDAASEERLWIRFSSSSSLASLEGDWPVCAGVPGFILVVDECFLEFSSGSNPSVKKVGHCDQQAAKKRFSLPPFGPLANSRDFFLTYLPK